MEILFIDRSPQVYYDFRLHSHKCWEIIVNLYGSGTADIDEREVPFGEGTIFCVPPGMVHRKRAEGGFRDSCVFIRDLPPLGGGGFAQFEDDASQTFRTLLALAFDIQLRNEPNARAVLDALGNGMYQLLTGWHAAQQDRNQPIDGFRRILLDNLSNSEFEISHAIARSGYSESHFRRLFKGACGYSPNEYLNRIRVEYAKKQLQQYRGVRTIREIAWRSGFADPYYFSRLFRQHEGCSPQQYLDRLAAAPDTMEQVGQWLSP